MHTHHTHTHTISRLSDGKKSTSDTDSPCTSLLGAAPIDHDSVADDPTSFMAETAKGQVFTLCNMLLTLECLVLILFYLVESN